MLKLSLREEAGNCVLTVADALHGNISEFGANTACSGWQALFTTGLKAYVEGSGA